MSYQVLARKYRPQKFSDVIGQEHVNLARVLADRGRLEEAEAEYRAVLEARTRVLLPDRPTPWTAAATSPTTRPPGRG